MPEENPRDRSRNTWAIAADRRYRKMGHDRHVNWPVGDS